MYTSYFGFTEKPFKTKPDVQQLFSATYAQKCYAELVRSLLEQLGTIVLYGEAGCGKTTLVEKCCTNLVEVVRFVRITNSHLSADDILHLLADAVGLPATAESLEERYQQIREGLYAEQQQQGHGVVLVVDDAHGLNEDCLETLLDFAAETVSGERILQLMLVGLPELANRCRSHASSPIECCLEGLTSSEIEPYIEHQLKVAGYRGESLFTTDAIRAVAVHAGGMPRRINALCDAALFAASLDERRSITSQIVVDAVQHSFLRDSAPVTPAQAPAKEPQTAPVAEHSPEPEHSQDLTHLAADMEETLEQALAVAGGGGVSSGTTAQKPAARSTSKAESKSAGAKSTVATPSLAATSVSAKTNAAKTSRRPVLWVGLAATLVVGVGLGAWQWYQITSPPLAGTASTTMPPESVQQAAIANPSLVTNPATETPQPPEPEVAVVPALTPEPADSPVLEDVNPEGTDTAALPQSLELPPPTDEPPAPRGLPPVDPDNPFAARPLQSTHQFLDAQGQVFTKE